MVRNMQSVLSLCFLLLAAFAVPASAQHANGKTIRLVALGDSLTAGYGLNQDQAFPAMLEQALRARGHNVEITNAGVSGDTVQGGLERVDWSVPDGTDGVILELGANDMLRGLDPALTRKGIETIIERLKSRNIPIMLAGMQAAPNFGPDYATKFNAIYPDLARKYGLILYPFFLDGTAGNPSLNLPDGMHPTGDGVKIIVERILPSVETFLAAIRSGQ